MNGLVERYNGVIVDGLKKMLAAIPAADWEEVLGDVLAGLRFLPNKVGCPPFVAAFKQAPVMLRAEA